MTGSPEPLYGEQTRLAVEALHISGVPFPLPVVHQIARIKRSAARVNARLDPSRVPPEVATAIEQACDEILAGDHDDQFVVDVFQTGSGTSTHMNVNEVVATLAGDFDPGATVDGHDHVNFGQSSNDVMPTAVRLAVLDRLELLVAALERLETELGHKQEQFKHVVKAGRTHLRDATPVTLGQEFGGYRVQIADAAERLRSVRPMLGHLPLGGTAVGTGINALPGFSAAVIAELAADTGFDIVEAPDHFAVQGAHDDLVDASGRIRTAVVAMNKIANDIRLLSSGPRTGLAELELEELMAGSSIMPGKVNPVVVEIVNQVTARVIGNDTGVAFAGSQGILELNTHVPLLALSILESIDLVTNAADLLAHRCVATLTADIERARSYAERSPAIVTALTPLIGYDEAAAALAEAETTGRPIVEVIARRNDLDAREIESHLDLLAAAGVGGDAPDLPTEDPHVPPEAIPPEDSGMVGPEGP